MSKEGKGIPGDQLFQSQISYGHVGTPVEKMYLPEHHKSRVSTIPPCPMDDWAQYGRHNANTKVAMIVYDMDMKAPVTWYVAADLYAAVKDVGRQGVPAHESLKLNVVRGADGEYEVRVALTIRQYLRKWAQRIGAWICQKSDI